MKAGAPHCPRGCGGALRIDQVKPLLLQSVDTSITSKPSHLLQDESPRPSTHLGAPRAHVNSYLSSAKETRWPSPIIPVFVNRDSFVQLQP